MKNQYSVLTNGTSNRIYNELILSEKMTLKVAQHFDRQAAAYQDQGMNLFCDEFVKMEEGENRPNKIPTNQFSTFHWKRHQKIIKSALKLKRPAEIRKAALNALMELKKQPDYYCFTRHMFESIYRLAFFLPLRQEEAKAKNLPSPSHLFYQIMGLHNFSLSFTNHLDHLSAATQEKGIPILCNELPDLLKDLPMKGL